MTRRVVKLPLKDRDFGCELAGNEIGPAEASRLCPYGQSGDLLWVRETFQYESRTEEYEWDIKKCRIVYRATEPNAGPWVDADDKIREAWRPSIHMPRWASRITLLIEDVRVERLQEISETDAMTEGVPFTELPQGQDKPDPLHRAQFADLWESIHGPDSWAANPWVWRIQFRPILKNVDDYKPQDIAA